MKAVTADEFAEQLRMGGCRVEIDRSFVGAVYLRASKADDLTTVTIVFEGDRFKRAFAVWIGVARRRWPKFRTMKAVRSFLDIHDTYKEHPMASRSFGSLQWDCVTPNQHWVFDDGWGRFHLYRYNGRGQDAGWYLDTPDGSGDWMGSTLAEAAEASESIVLDAHPGTK